VLGTLALAAAKSIENMELGHNIGHGQWDWMNDPEIHSTT
jgi:NADPH-dependent stearoyl-CoA 9-desaturase